MCLAVPMRVCRVDGYEAVCDAGGVERTVNLFLLQDERITRGDCVLVHVGYAIKKLAEMDFERSRALLAEAERHGA